VLLSPAAREALAKPSLRCCTAPVHASLRWPGHFGPTPPKVCITSPPTFQRKMAAPRWLSRSWRGSVGWTLSSMLPEAQVRLRAPPLVKRAIGAHCNIQEIRSKNRALKRLGFFAAQFRCIMQA
jgi:hypothetical protein